MKYFVRIEANIAKEIAIRPDAETIEDWRLNFVPEFEWVVGDVNTKQGDVWDSALKTFSTPPTDPPTKQELKETSRNHSARLVANLIDPITNEPISDRSGADEQRLDAAIVGLNAQNYKNGPSPDPLVVTAINTAIADTDAIVQAHRQNKIDIDSGTITTKPQVLDPLRWP